MAGSSPLWSALAGLSACVGLWGAFRCLRLLRADADLRTLWYSRLPSKAFEGKVVWITGASSGIGAALSKAFAGQGAKVILSSRRREALEDVKAALPCDPSQAAVLVLDLEDIDSLPSKVQEAQSCFGRVDILINNGGISSRFLARDSKMAVYRKVMAVDFFSHIQISTALLPHFRENQSGHIVNISSACGKFGVPLRTGYCAAKHALQGFFNALRLEEADSGLKVTNICPGFVRTEVALNAVDADGKPVGIMDELVSGGMRVERCAELVLGAVCHNLDEAWVAKGLELFALYLHQYFPSLFYILAQKKAPEIIQRSRAAVKASAQVSR